MHDDTNSLLDTDITGRATAGPNLPAPILPEHLATEPFSMITCTVRMIFGTRLQDEALQILRALVGPVRSARGCTHTQLMHDVLDDPVITWTSRWSDRGNLEQHFKSTHFRRLLAVMELASESPVVEIAIDGDIRGFDLIEEMLAPPGPPGEVSAPIQLSTETQIEHQGETS